MKLYAEAKYLILETLDKIEKKLPKKQFMRLHRSHLVNLDFVEEIKVLGDKKFSVKLSDHYALELPVSRKWVGELKVALGLGKMSS